MYWTRRPLGYVTLGVAGHLAVGPTDVGRTVSVDVSDWIRTNGLTVLLASTMPLLLFISERKLAVTLLTASQPNNCCKRHGC